MLQKAPKGAQIFSLGLAPVGHSGGTRIRQKLFIDLLSEKVDRKKHPYKSKGISILLCAPTAVPFFDMHIYKPCEYVVLLELNPFADR